jgi:serine/threonine-protein kinase
MPILGRYEILGQLGAGSMATVFRARDTILDREVALKTIRTEASVAPELRERYYREARACARLQHRAIVVVYDLGEVDQTAYVATELLAGLDVRRLIERRVEIPAAAKLAIMADVCEGLGYAHRKGVLHRDVKPSNLFLMEDGRIKVLDFGVTRLFGPGPCVAGQMLGTPNYMAPEEILGKAADSRADLFSAAVVCFEFLTHVHPFQGEFIPRRIVDGLPDALSDHNKRLPPMLDKVLARALAKDPGERYPTGEEFAYDLRLAIDAPQPPSGGLQARGAESAAAAVDSAPTARPSASAPAPAPSTTPPVAELAGNGWPAGTMSLISEFETASIGNNGDWPYSVGALPDRDPSDAEKSNGAPQPASIELKPPESGPERTNVASPPLANVPALCPNCNTPNQTAAAFCAECGERLREDGASQVSPSISPARAVKPAGPGSGVVTTGGSQQSEPQEAMASAAPQPRHETASRRMTNSEASVAVAEEAAVVEELRREPAIQPVLASPTFHGPLFGVPEQASTLAPNRPVFGKILFQMQGGAAEATPSRPVFKRVLLGLRGGGSRLAPPQPVDPQPAFSTLSDSRQRAAEAPAFAAPLFGSFGDKAEAESEGSGKILLGVGVGAVLVAGTILLFAHPGRPGSPAAPAPVTAPAPVAPAVALPAPTPAPAPAEAAPADGKIVAARPTYRKDPVFPASARRLMARGEITAASRVMVEAKVAADGSVTSAIAISGHPALVDTAEEAVQQWRFKPAQLNGRPVPSTIQLSVSFVRAH